MVLLAVSALLIVSRSCAIVWFGDLFSIGLAHLIVMMLFGFADFELVFILVWVNGEWDVEGNNAENPRSELGVCTY